MFGAFSGVNYFLDFFNELLLEVSGHSARFLYVLNLAGVLLLETFVEEVEYFDALVCAVLQKLVEVLCHGADFYVV